MSLHELIKLNERVFGESQPSIIAGNLVYGSIKLQQVDRLANMFIYTGVRTVMLVSRMQVVKPLVFEDYVNLEDVRVMLKSVYSVEVSQFQIDSLYSFNPNYYDGAANVQYLPSINAIPSVPISFIDQFELRYYLITYPQNIRMNIV